MPSKRTARLRRRKQSGGLFGRTKPAQSMPEIYQTLAPTTYAFSQNPATPIRKLTTYLRTLAPPTFDETFNPSTKSFATPLDIQTLLRYEAFLGQCAFLSRLAYNPTDIFVQTMQQGMEFDQPNKNRLVANIETNSYRQMQDYAAWFMTMPQAIGSEQAKKGLKPTAVKVGAFFPKSGCTITQWHNPDSAISAKKTVFIVCKGSSSIPDFVKDLNAIPMATANVYGLQGIPGQIHKGFVDHISTEIAQIVAAIDKFSAGMDQIVFTGHSLGGAAATLIAFIYARMRPWAAGSPTCHLITFGAPQIATEDTRVCFNEHLLNGSLTFDRVVANGDNITNVPAVGYSHPGFRILKTEAAMNKIPFKAKTFDKTGRSGYIRQIRQLAVGAGKAPDNNDVITTNIGGVEIFVAANIPETVIPAEAEKAVEAAAAQDAAGAAADVNALSASVEVAAAADASSGVPTMAGGGYSTDVYKQLTQLVYPNTVTYNCNKVDAAKMAGMTIGLTGLVACHVNYMGIGFLAALRLPVLPRAPFILRKKEPTEITHLVSYFGTPSPAVRVIIPGAVPMENRNTGGRRLLRKTKKRLQRGKKARLNHT
jgi:hypothetical protein